MDQKDKHAVSDHHGWVKSCKKEKMKQQRSLLLGSCQAELESPSAAKSPSRTVCECNICGKVFSSGKALVWFLILVCDLLFHIEMKNLLSPRLRCLCFLNIYFVWDGRVGVRGTCWCAYAWLPFPLAALWGWVCMHWNNRLH